MSTSDVLERFLRYVQVDTQSTDEHCEQVPSTAIQFDLANMLADELRALGAQNVTVTEHGYVTAHIPASTGAEGKPRLGLISHLDTTEQAPGFGVKPHVVSYTGGDLVCGVVDGAPVAIGPEKVPALRELEGEDIVCTDGTTLLGADDKAGIAEIMALVAQSRAEPRAAPSAAGHLLLPRRGDRPRRRAARPRLIRLHVRLHGRRRPHRRARMGVLQRGRGRRLLPGLFDSSG